MLSGGFGEKRYGPCPNGKIEPKNGFFPYNLVWGSPGNDPSLIKTIEAGEPPEPGAGL
jgi:hypothetical protein